MKLGDFTELAKYYDNRPDYSSELITILCDYVKSEKQTSTVEIADVGAGTGILTKMLYERGCYGYAVEPNDNMRAFGIEKFIGIPEVKWSKGSGERTGLDNECVDWVLMGDSFHWTNAREAAIEFKRILRKGGFFTAIWKSRDIESNPLHMKIEKIIYAKNPKLKRVSSGMSMSTQIMKDKLEDSFKNIIFLEAKHTVRISKRQYMESWYSVNDIQAQLGDKKFQESMKEIDNLLIDMENIEVPYKSRAWIAKVNK